MATTGPSVLIPDCFAPYGKHPNFALRIGNRNHSEKVAA
jgi:hypothetical protein